MRHKRVHRMPFNYIGNMIINMKTGVHWFEQFQFVLTRVHKPNKKCAIHIIYISDNMCALARRTNTHTHTQFKIRNPFLTNCLGHHSYLVSLVAPISRGIDRQKWRKRKPKPTNKWKIYAKETMYT